MTLDHDALMAEGLALEKAGRLAESIPFYASAVAVHPTAQGYWQLVRAQMQADQPREAQESALAALAQFGHKPAFHQLLARVKQQLGDGHAAADVLRQAAALFPGNLDILGEYANAQIEVRHFAEAAVTLERLAGLAPTAKTYRTLVKMKRAAGDAEGLRRAAREGLLRFPLDVALVRLCARFDPAAAAQARNAMTALIAAGTADPAQRSAILRYLTETRVAENRKTAGLPSGGAMNWTDLVRWSDAQGIVALAAALEDRLAALASDAAALAERGSAAVAQMDWAGAERWFALARAQETQTVADVTTFDPAFYERLEQTTDAEMLSPFPPVSDVIARTAWPANIVYLSCDPKFFEMFIPRFLASLAVHGDGTGVHIHLLDGTEEEWRRCAAQLQVQEALSLSMTAETGARRSWGLNARNYYHAARYVRFYQYLAGHQRPVWMIDVDSVVEAVVGPIFASLQGRDFAATARAAALEPWSKIEAGLVGIAPTPRGLRYMRLAAAYISHWYRAGVLRWGIDQQALFGAYFHLEQRGAAPVSRFLGEDFVSAADDVACIIRPVTDTAARMEKAR